MNKIKNYFIMRKESVISSTLSLVLMIISLVLYIVNGASATSFISKYTISLFVAFGLSIAFSLLGLIINRQEVLFLQYFTSLYACLRFTASLAELFGGLVYGEESAKMPISFVMIIIFTLVSCIASLVFGILLMNKKSPKTISEVEIHE